MIWSIKRLKCMWTIWSSGPTRVQTTYPTWEGSLINCRSTIWSWILPSVLLGYQLGNYWFFIISKRGIDLDPLKIKEIQEIPSLKKKKEVMSFLERLNYISRFIAQSTIICEPILKMLNKDAPNKWTKEWQTTFDTIKDYLSNPPILVRPKERSLLLFYLLVSDNAFGYFLGQHDKTKKKKRLIYYLIKKFTPYKAHYTLL